MSDEFISFRMAFKLDKTETLIYSRKIYHIPDELMFFRMAFKLGTTAAVKLEFVGGVSGMHEIHIDAPFTHSAYMTNGMAAFSYDLPLASAGVFFPTGKIVAPMADIGMC